LPPEAKFQQTHQIIISARDLAEEYRSEYAKIPQEYEYGFDFQELN
jgi:hypothetical protein